MNPEEGRSHSMPPTVGFGAATRVRWDLMEAPWATEVPKTVKIAVGFGSVSRKKDLPTRGDLKPLALMWLCAHGRWGEAPASSSKAVLMRFRPELQLCHACWQDYVLETVGIMLGPCPQLRSPRQLESHLQFPLPVQHAHDAAKRGVWRCPTTPQTV